MELGMVADMEVHKVTDKVADIVARHIRREKKWQTWSWTWFRYGDKVADN